LVLILKQSLDFANRVRPQQHVSAYRTNISRNVVNDHYLTMVPHGVYDFFRFVFSRTSINTAFHGAFLATICDLITVCSIGLLPDNFTIPEHNYRTARFRSSLAHAFSSPTQGNLSADKVWVSWFLGRLLILRTHLNLPLSQ